MTKNLLLMGAMIMLAGGYTWYADYKTHPSSISTAAPPVSAPTQDAPDFSFAARNGRDHSLHNFKGKPVILNFWASWCAPCVIEFPSLIKLAAAQKDTVFLLLSADDSQADIERFLKERNRVPLPRNVFIGWDKDQKISTLYQTFQLPETYLIDDKGQIREKIVGATDWTNPDMRQKVKLLRQP